MMRSMFSGVSSLRAHQLRMDVIGNNIANVNTVGFKASTATFAETFSQTLSGASSSSDSRGGTNPMQVGLGATIAAIGVNHTKGSIQRTDVATDLMVDGSGFFMVSNDKNGQNMYYTRAGNFTMDEQGYLVTTNGYFVLDVNKKAIQVNMSDTKNATATDRIVVNGNINVDDVDYTTTVDIYDSLGDVQTMNINFIGPALRTTTPLTLTAPMDAYDPINVAPDGTVTATPNNYAFKKMSITNSTGTEVFPDPAVNDLYAMFNENGEIVDLVSVAPGDDPMTDTITSFSQMLNVNVAGAGVIDLSINRAMFFSNGDTTKSRIFTQVSKESDAKGVQLEGISAGSIDTFNISSKGEIIGIYTNGERKVLQTLGLVAFDNPAGLEKIGNNMFQNTPNSGTPKYGAPATGSFGAVTPGALEMSNVDLAAQFTDMITTQRGFQANSRVITTSDEILQELVNLKR